MSEINKPEQIFCTVIVTQDDIKALIRIRNYFGQNDKTQIEHMAYDVLDRVVKPFLDQAEVKE